MHILITGGAGFIGSWLTTALINRGHSLAIIDNLSPQIHGAVPQLDGDWIRETSAVNFFRADVRDSAAMDLALQHADAVVHLAAETGTGQSMYRISHYYDVNQQATAALFEAIATTHRHVKKVILASSRSIYGEGAYLLNGELYVPPTRTTKRLQAGNFEPAGPSGEALTLTATPEDAPPSPASVYAATKLANETLGRIFSDTFGVPVIALRFQNVYGQRQSLSNPYTGILSIFSNRMRQSLPINIFEDGLESRDFVHVSDVVRAIVLALESTLSTYSVINIGSGVPTSVIDMANSLKARLNSNSDIQISGDFRAGDIRHCYADLHRAKALLHFEPEIDIERGLTLFTNWLETQKVVQDKSVVAMTELTSRGLGSSN